jgi:hypothetical protein
MRQRCFVILIYLYILYFKMGVNKSGDIQYINLILSEDNGHMINEVLALLVLDFYYNVYKNTRWDLKINNVITGTPKNTWCRAPGIIFFWFEAILI